MATKKKDTTKKKDKSVEQYERKQRILMREMAKFIEERIGDNLGAHFYELEELRDGVYRGEISPNDIHRVLDTAVEGIRAILVEMEDNFKKK